MIVLSQIDVRLVEKPRTLAMKTAIHWFRRDLRLTDNTALAEAARRAESVVPVYIQGAWSGSHHWTGAHRQGFLCGSLKSLDANLRTIGSHLIVRRGDAVEELLQLAREAKAQAIFFNRDPDPFGRNVERRLAERALEAGLEIVDYKDACMHDRDEILTGKADPFRVFTPYAKAWMKLDKLPAAGRLRSLPMPGKMRAGTLPTLADWKLEPAKGILESGERAARARLKAFLDEPITHYSKARDLPALDGTSRLSQDLRHGLLSIREVYARCQTAAAKLPAAQRQSVQAFLNELIWREFYMQILWHFPEVLERDFNPKYRSVRWPGTEHDFSRWRDGETGFPIVDAGMRELAQTGFMPNRVRMIVAMFLTKDLHIHWRHGESWFMQQLTDGDIASNNGGWQWSAGTGADAAPYFRIQNPWTQTARFDPNGEYIHRWVPELRNVPAEKLACPPSAGPLVKGYPLPMVDHAEEREKTLALFKGHA